jgi:hypothetical protein
MGTSRWSLLAVGATTVLCVVAAGTAGAGGPGPGRSMHATVKDVANRPAPASGATQPLKELQDRFDREDNPVHKAKLIQKLGDAQFDALHAAEKAEDYAVVGVTLEKYRDNIRAALEALQKEHPDAERNSNGYRQLQIHTHRGIKETEDALRSAPDEFRPPLELVRKDLMAMDDKMLRLLFPTPASAKEPKS